MSAEKPVLSGRICGPIWEDLGKEKLIKKRRVLAGFLFCKGLADFFLGSQIFGGHCPRKIERAIKILNIDLRNHFFLHNHSTFSLSRAFKPVGSLWRVDKSLKTVLD